MSAAAAPHLRPGSRSPRRDGLRTVAGLLHNGLASLDDTVDVGTGVWEIDGRLLERVA